MVNNDGFKYILIKEDNSFTPKIGKKTCFQYASDEDEIIKITKLLKEKTILAHMGQIVISSEDKPIVGTQALDTCIGILFYNRRTKKGIVGHIPPSYTGMIDTILKRVLQNSDQNDEWEYMIVDGFRNEQTGSYERLNYIQGQISNFEMQNLNIKLSFLQSKSCGVRLHDRTLSYEFAFNTLNGEFVSDDLFYDSSDYIKERMR